MGRRVRQQKPVDPLSRLPQYLRYPNHEDWYPTDPEWVASGRLICAVRGLMNWEAAVADYLGTDVGTVSELFSPGDPQALVREWVGTC